MKSGWKDGLIKKRNHFQISQHATYHTNGKCLTSINARKWSNVGKKRFCLTI